VVRRGVALGGHTSTQDADAKCSHYAPGVCGSLFSISAH
jgi:hypothetical protein